MGYRRTNLRRLEGLTPHPDKSLARTPKVVLIQRQSYQIKCSSLESVLPYLTLGVRVRDLSGWGVDPSRATFNLQRLPT